MDSKNPNYTTYTDEQIEEMALRESMWRDIRRGHDIIPQTALAIKVYRAILDEQRSMR